MRILALDTACPTASCAITEDGRLLAESAIHGARTHSQKLLPLIANLLASVDLTPSGIDLFAVSVGPGSFTGLRIGVVTAKGLAYATGRPLAGIPTLEALAYSVPSFDGVICPMIDARNQQAFCGFYERTSHGILSLAQDTVLHVEPLADALARYDRNVMVVGDCASRFVSPIQERWRAQGHGRTLLEAESVLFTTRAAATALLASMREPEAMTGRPGEPGDPFALEPFYLRASQAEQKKYGTVPQER